MSVHSTHRVSLGSLTNWERQLGFLLDHFQPSNFISSLAGLEADTSASVRPLAGALRLEAQDKTRYCDGDFSLPCTIFKDQTMIYTIKKKQNNQ